MFQPREIGALSCLGFGESRVLEGSWWELLREEVGRVLVTFKRERKENLKENLAFPTRIKLRACFLLSPQDVAWIPVVLQLMATVCVNEGSRGLIHFMWSGGGLSLVLTVSFCLLG